MADRQEPGPPPDAPLVRVRDLVKHFPVRRRFKLGLVPRGKLWVRSVDGVSLEIVRGEVLGLVGESGCGKSTLARLILNHIKPDTGSVTIDGHDISNMKGLSLRRFRRSIQLIFQDSAGALDPRMRIEESLTAPLSQHRIGTSEGRRRDIRGMLEEVGLDPAIAEKYPGQCSGGQLQRVVIARALLLKPKFLICDEPTSAVDASIRAQILNLLNKLRARFDLTLLLISHDLRAVRHICDRVAIMYLGRIVELADVGTIFASPTHPYTRALIAASLLDEIGIEAAAKLADGEPPSAIDPPKGCHFRPRCPVATERCLAEAPLLQAVAPGHVVSCHHWDLAKGPVVPAPP